MNTPPPASPGTASRVWTALHEFVAGQDRRRALRAALDLGPGKVEVLIKLADGPMTLREIARAADIDAPFLSSASDIDFSFCAMSARSLSRLANSASSLTWAAFAAADSRRMR